MDDSVEPAAHCDERETGSRHSHNGDHNDFLGWVDLDLVAFLCQDPVLLWSQAEMTCVIA